MEKRLRPPNLGVRTLLGIVIVFAILFAAWDVFLNPARRWKRAIRDDNEGNVRWHEASSGLRGEVDGVDRETAVRELVGALGDPSIRVRTTAATILGRSGPPAPAVVTALVAALDDSHPWVRSAAADSLGELLEGADDAAKRDVVSALIQGLDDRVADVRFSAASSLARIGAWKVAVPTLIEALRASDALSGQKAVWSLRLAGPEARPALPALREIVGAPVATDAPASSKLLRIYAADLLIRLGEATAARGVIDEGLKDADDVVREATSETLQRLESDGVLPPEQPPSPADVEVGRRWR